MKVSELSMAIKKRLAFTVPKEVRGLRPPAIKEESTIEPQPPPPTASIKPPPNPNTPIFLIFFFPAFLRADVNALDKIMLPRINV